MKQSTLKRPAASLKTPSKKSKLQLPGAGTSNAPIDLESDNNGNEECPINLDAEDDNDTATPKLGSSNVTKKLEFDASTNLAVTSSSSSKRDRHEGPSTARPLHINDPDFDVAASFTSIAPKVILKDPDLDLLYFKRLIQGRQLFEYLLNELPWYRVTYQTRGMTIRTPRWTCVWGCDETGAPPSAYKINPRPLPTALRILRDTMQERTEAKYNFVLVNYYENGKDSISWHSDDESFLGPLPCIASLSLGSSRDFQMKHKEDKSAQVEKWSLESGDCIVMRGTTQSKWLHSIPKRATAQGRMNLTFRRAMNAAGTNNYYRYNVYTGPVHRWRNGRMVEVA